MIDRIKLRHDLERASALALAVPVDGDLDVSSLERDLRGVAAHFVGVADGLANSGTTPPGPQPSGQVDTNLDGKRMPAAPRAYDLARPRDQLYGYNLSSDGVYDFRGALITGVKSAGIIARGNVTLKNFSIAVSGADGIKLEGLPTRPVTAFIKNFHITALGLTPGSHADGIQGRGSIASLLLEDGVFDIPALLGDGTQSNACVMSNLDNGPDGWAIARRVIFRGGNRCLMGDMQGGPAHWTFEDAAFIIERRSPQFTLFEPGFESLGYVFNDSRVYSMGADGVLTFVTGDPADFDLQAWRRKKYPEDF